MRKFFTLFFALAASVGISWASVTWISDQYGNEKGYNAGTPFTKDGVTVTMSDNAFFNVSYWGDASLQCMKGTFDPTAGNYVFSNSLGENFVKIIIAAGYPSDWEWFPKGDGWVLSGDENNGYILTWTGNASTVTLMDNELHSVHQSIEGDIVFYFESDDAFTPVAYLDSLNNPVAQETVAFNRPEAPEVPGFTFLRWQVKEGPLSEGIEIQAVYAENQVSGSAPKKQVGKFTLIRKGDKNEYILQTAK